MAETKEEIRTSLQEASRKYRAWMEGAERERSYIDQLVIAGHKAGVSKLQLSKLAGLTRQTIYTILLREQARRS